MKISRRTVFTVFYCAILGVVFLVVLELAASVVLNKRIAGTLSVFDGILVSGQNILDVAPHRDTFWREREFGVRIRTNTRGFREDFDFDDAGVDVAFMGDSFTFGYGVDVSNRYSNIAAGQHPGLKVVSLSYNNGFQPEHYEYFLDLHPDLKPRLLFVGLYLGNDLDSDVVETVVQRDAAGKIAELELPYRSVSRGVLTNRARYRHGWFERFVDATSLGKIMAMKINSSRRLRQAFVEADAVLPNTLNRPSTELGELDGVNRRAIAALKNIAKTVRQRNGELHVLLIPQNFLVGATANPHVAPGLRNRIEELRAEKHLLKAVMTECEKDGIICHDLSVILAADDCFPVDGHWNNQGHGKIGRYAGAIIGEAIARRDSKRE